jgi:Flp pilus assembly protein TadB
VDAKHRAQRERFVIAALAAAWAGVVGAPFVVVARRAATADRLRALDSRPEVAARPTVFCKVLATRIVTLPPVRTLVRVLQAPLRSRRSRRLGDEIARQVAVAVDLVAVGVGAGHTPYLAVELGARWAPPLVGRELDAAIQACAMGRSFDDALRDLGRRTPGVRALAETLRTSARLGSPAAPALARLASELRADLRRRAEARARTVPVRLCFPLVGCILPAFALLTVVPAVVAGISR